MAPFFKRTAASKAIIFAIIASFILSSVPQGFCLSNPSADHLRPDSLKTGDLDLFKTSLKDGGKAVDYDLYEKAKIELTKVGQTAQVYEYNKRKKEYVVTEQKKAALARLLARDEVGLIEDEDNPGTFIWARKKDGAVVTKQGDLFISGRFSYPAMEDVPEGRIDHNRYSKIVPLAYGFFNYYLGKGEYAWISDVLTGSKVFLTEKSVGPRHYTVDKVSKKIVIERDFMDYLLHAGNKRVGMSIFAEAAAEFSDMQFSKDQIQQLVDKFAQKSLVSRNRLEDSIYLYDLITGADERGTKLTAQERQYYLLDIMERNRSLNGRRAAKMLKEQFGYYGKVKPAEAEADLRAIVKAHRSEMVIDPFDPKKEKEETKKIKFFDRTDSFRLNGRYLADTDLIKDRKIVTDYEVDARDAFLFGGKVAYTGMMQWAPRILTLPMFATAGSCFRDDLIKESGLTDKFHGYAKELEDGVKALDEQYGKDSKDKEFLTKRSKLIDDTAKKFQTDLEWGTAKISPQLVKEIKEALVQLSERTGIPLFLLILAIRSSAIGEDSESASFAGRQDTSLFVTLLVEEFEKIGLKPEDYGYTWDELYNSVFPWYDILQKARAKIGERPVTDAMMEVFVKEWLANQRSLFNVRSIEYRLEKDIPVFTEEVEMSSVFQIQANTEFGYVAFGVNRANGYPEMQAEIIEGQTNPLVDGTGTGDLVFNSHKGRDRFRGMKIPESRQVLHVPNIFGGKAVEGEARKGGVVSIKFPKAWEGKPAISDIELLKLMAESDSQQMEFYGMFPDIEGGLIIRRDKKGNIRFYKDPSEPDGIAKDQSGKPRMQVYKFQTQIRPDATYNFKNPDVIEQYWLELPDEEYARAVSEGKVLYNVSQAHTQGCATGEVFILDKDKKDTWVDVVGKIMVTLQSDPDMNEAMKWAKAIVAKVGGRNSHTMIVATEYGLIAISGIESIDKFYNGQKVTVDANRGVILEGDDYKLVSAGNDYNVAELGMLPAGFSLGLNINSMELSEKAAPFRNKADFYGIGLLRLELLLEVIGAAGEGFFRYDNYQFYTLLEALEKGTISKVDRNRLSKMLAMKQDLLGFNARITGDNNITLDINGKRKTYTSPLEFYNKHLEDPKYPRYNPANEQDAKMIQAFDKLVKGQYTLGEERYIELMYRGIKSIVEPLIVDPIEIRTLAQQVENKAVRKAALAIFRQYELTHSEADDAPAMDDLIKATADLIENNQAILSENDIKVLELMKRQLSKAFYIRTDDRKSDEYKNVPGAMIEDERNAMMGNRGIRLMLENPKITRIQLAAIKKVVDIGCKKNEQGEYVGKGKFRMRIFFPIVYDPAHFKQICALCDEAGLTADRIDRGIMTETPQSAELRPFLEAGIDFSSTGGNDMTQYALQVERQNALPYFNSLTERSVQSLRIVATLGNEIRRWNLTKRIPMGLKLVTAGYCGNWPAVDPIGAIILYLLDFDSASITIPSMDRTNNDLYSLLDTIYGHDELGIIRVPHDKEKVARDLYRLIEDKKKQAGLSKPVVEMLPTLKFALDQRHFSIYDQIDPEAKADVRFGYEKASISDLHLALPFHYRVLEDYDKRARGNLFIGGSIEGYTQEIAELRADLGMFWSPDRSKFTVPEGMTKEAAIAKAHDLEERLTAAQFARRSIEIRQAIEKTLTEAGYNISQKEVGKRFYIDSLKRQWKPLAEEAGKNNTLLIIRTAAEAADLVKPKLGGERYELSKEPNPELGNRGLKKVLNPDRDMFLWDLQAIRELRDEGVNNMGLAFSTVREPAEIDDAVWLIKLAGLSDLKTGIEVDSPNLIYAYDYYLAPERGIDFLFMDRDSMRAMAAAKRGTEWNNTNLELITEQDVDNSLKDVTIPVTVTAAAKNGVPLYYNGAVPSTNIRSSGIGEDVARMDDGMKQLVASNTEIRGNSELGIVERDYRAPDEYRSIGGGAAVPAGFRGIDRMQKYLGIQMIEAVANIKNLSLAVYDKFVTGVDDFVNAFRDVEVADDKIGVVVVGANAVLDNAGTYESLQQFKAAQPALKAVVWGANAASAQDQAELNSALAATRINEQAAVMMDSLEEVIERVGDEYYMGQDKIMLMLSDKDVIALEKEYGMTIAEFLNSNRHLKATIIKDSASGEAAPMTLAFANLIARNLKAEVPALGSALKRLAAATYKDATDAIAAVTDLTASLVTIMPVGVDAETAKAAQDYKDATEAARKLDMGV